jgi:menaquinone-dependent protoporphyrinogen oxidase
MNVLIAFATSEGQTQKIVTKVAETLNGLGYHTDLVHTDSFQQPSLDKYEKIIVAGSVHQERHQTSLENFVIATLSELQKRPTVFISVSLSAAFPEGASDAENYIYDFRKRTGWSPSLSLAVAGALHYAEYDYFKAQIIRHVILKGHRPIPNTDYEFTDWDSLLTAIKTFIAI